MLKTTFKIFLFFLFLVFVAGATGITTYTITRRVISEQNPLADQTVEKTENIQRVVPTDAEAEPKNRADGEFEYYLVRLEGEDLNIYASHGGKEEFLYNRAIYKNDLSHQDRSMLEEGVKLMSPSSLTGFIENFTS